MSLLRPQLSSLVVLGFVSSVSSMLGMETPAQLNMFIHDGYSRILSDIFQITEDVSSSWVLPITREHGQISLKIGFLRRDTLFGAIHSELGLHRAWCGCGAPVGCGGAVSSICLSDHVILSWLC